jgi:hypothetical protein
MCKEGKCVLCKEPITKITYNKDCIGRLLHRKCYRKQQKKDELNQFINRMNVKYDTKVPTFE